MDENSSTSFGRLKVENVVGGVEGGVCVRGDGVDSKIESVWKQPYKEKQREVSAAESVQTANKGPRKGERERGHERERKIETGRQKQK